MPARTTGDGVNQDMILGELRGQVRELVHSTNNIGMKVDALAREVIALGPLAADIAEIKSRVAKLEESGNQQSGAYKTVGVILNSPVLVWVVALAGLIWATMTGRFRP